MAKERDIWDALTSATLPPALVGYAGRITPFPLMVKETRFEPSHAWAGLQLADVLAGAMAYRLRWHINGRDPQDSYGTALSQIEWDVFEAHVVWPTDDVTPEETAEGRRITTVVEMLGLRTLDDLRAVRPRRAGDRRASWAARRASPSATRLRRRRVGVGGIPSRVERPDTISVELAGLAAAIDVGRRVRVDRSHQPERAVAPGAPLDRESFFVVRVVDPR
jgi:hypothetical protein